MFGTVSVKEKPTISLKTIQIHIDTHIRRYYEDMQTTMQHATAKVHDIAIQFQEVFLHTHTPVT